MNDEELIDTWAMFEPAADERRRINARVGEWLDAHDTSLAAEWLGLIRTRPIAALGFAAAGVISILAAPPFVWFARALL